MESYTQAWIPLLSSIVGGILVLVGSFGVAIYNQHKNLRIKNSDRNRELLENLFRTTIKINSMYRKIGNDAILKIHNNIPIPSEYETELSPITELEMLIFLYFPILIDKYKIFEETKNTFGTKFVDVIANNFQSEPLKVKQRISKEILDLQDDVEKTIESIQLEIINLIKQ